MISAEEFAEWKEHPVTKEVFDGLKEIKEAIKEKLANGSIIGTTAEETHGFSNRAVGQVEGLNQLLNIHFVDADDEEEVNNQSGY